MLKKITFRKIFLQLFILILVVSAVRWYQQRHLVDGIAPIISGQLVDGRNWSMSDYRGEPVLLYFWGIWCGICQMQSGTIDAIAKDHHVLSIAMDSGSKADVLRYMQVQSRSFPVMMDSNLSAAYGVGVVPTYFIIDKEGKINFTEVGYSTSIGLRLRLWLTRWLS